MLCLDLAGRTYVVTGVTNERSIAWAIAEKLAAGGANLLFTYRLERSGEALRRLIPALPGEGNHRLFSVDVERDADIEALATFVREEGISLAGLVHSVAFARKEELDGAFIDTSREGFLLAHNVSVYSLVALARALRPAFHPGAAVVTLTYLGSERVVPHYNVMGVAKAALEASVRYLAYDLGEDGVRVNAVSAGPVRTLSARGLPGLPESSELWKSAPLFVGTSRRKRWQMLPCSSSPIGRRGSPAKSSTSMPVTGSWACKAFADRSGR